MNALVEAANRGSVISVRGSVVDIRFDGHLPPIYSVLRASPTRWMAVSAS